MAFRRESFGAENQRLLLSAPREKTVELLKKLQFQGGRYYDNGALDGVGTALDVGVHCSASPFSLPFALVPEKQDQFKSVLSC